MAALKIFLPDPYIRVMRLHAQAQAMTASQYVRHMIDHLHPKDMDKAMFEHRKQVRARALDRSKDRWADEAIAAEPEQE